MFWQVVAGDAVAGSGLGVVKEAGERVDDVEEQRVDAGLLVGGVLGAEAVGKAVPDLPRAFRTADLRLIHAAICCSRYSSWTCRGVRY
jgi:hypothetical protein